MRTTLDSEDDVLAAARELARSQGTTAGQPDGVARQGLSIASFRPFQASAGAVVSNDQIDQLRDEAGL